MDLIGAGVNIAIMGKGMELIDKIKVPKKRRKKNGRRTEPNDFRII